MTEIHWENTGEPLEEDWIHAGQQQDESPDQWANMRPIPVEIKRTESERISPEAVALFSITVPLLPALAGTGGVQPAILCPHNYHRYKAKFIWTVPANTIIYIATNRDTLTSMALGFTYQIIVGATAIANSSQLMPEYDCQKPLYVMANNAGVQVSIMDESYKVVQ